MGNRSLADLPELRTMSLMQPTNDSIMYFTPCNRSSELNPHETYIIHTETDLVFLKFLMIRVLQITTRAVAITCFLNKSRSGLCFWVNCLKGTLLF